MNGWGEFVAAIVVFFTSHRIPVVPRLKAPLVKALGAGGFTLAYSAMSVALLTWVIIAAGRAPYVVLWNQYAWMNHVTLTLMAIATLIFVLALGRPNPLSFGGLHNDRFDPAQPGIVGWMHHPLLVVLGLWSLAHLIPNGDLAHVIMFGQFAAFSVFGMRIINHRKRRMLGESEWARLANTAAGFHPTRNGIIRCLIAILLYLSLLYLHPIVIGVDPLAL
ncbi:MAG TPA: NnrU family protein [Aliiroseovarius sp.]|nr:NnrU family protein [Aliiroseovarius sp.]